MGRTLYDNGLPFPEIYADNLKDQVKRVDGKKASLIIVDGGVGEGKTTFAVEAADYINNLNGMGEVALDLKYHPQLALGGADFLKQIRICYEEKLPCIIYDEAGDFNKRGALSRFNAMLNRTFETFRGFKIIVILVLPCFNVLDGDIFEKKIPRMLLHLKDRGENYGNFYGYSLFRMMYIKEKMKKLVIKPFGYSQVSSNFRGQFLNLTKERDKKLDILSTTGKISVLKKAEIKVEGLISYVDIAKKVSRSVIWVRKAISKLKIRHARIIDRVKYFDERVIDQLSDYLDELGGKK